jgi:hypothetical protein
MIVDQFSALHFATWIGFLVLCFALWEFDKAIITILLGSVLLLPLLLIAWLAGSVGNAVGRRWRRAVSAFLGPILAGGLISALPHIGLDSERIHFLLVKYPHEAELNFTSADGKIIHDWSWGLNAAPLSLGIAYTLRYDPTDAELLVPKIPGKSISPMGDHFYVVTESEDGSPL